MTADADFRLSDLTPLIDVTIGRASTNNNEALYRRLLLMFGASHRDVIDRFCAAQAQGDGMTATRLVHNLRTGAATLGMTALANASLQLETKCRTETAGLVLPTPLLDQTAQALAPVLDALHALRDAGNIDLGSLRQH